VLKPASWRSTQKRYRKRRMLLKNGSFYPELSVKVTDWCVVRPGTGRDYLVSIFEH
jgi:hypothetical protein